MRDIIIYKNGEWIADFQQETVNPCVVLMLTTCGWLKANYDKSEVTIAEGDLVVLLPDHLVAIHDKSDNCQTLCILMTKSFAQSLQQNHSVRLQVHFHHQVLVHLKPEEQQVFSDIVNMLQYVIACQVAPVVENVQMLFRVLLRIGLNFEGFKQMDSGGQSRHEELFEYFLDAVVKYHCSHRNTAFYANMLCVTPKYMSKVVKLASGKSVREWIDAHVIRSAKLLLDTEKHLSIQEVSQNLGFTDQATFSKYFKKQTGISPTDYRQK